MADIVSDSRRVGDLIQQLRRFLRRGETERRELDVLSVIADVLRLVEKDAVDRAIDLTVDLTESLPRLVGDRIQLQQVLLNLVLNAFDAVAGARPRSTPGCSRRSSTT